MLKAKPECPPLSDCFMQAPIPMAILMGPEHRFVAANTLYEHLCHRKVVDKTFKETFPEEHLQHYNPTLDQVYRTGVPHIGKEVAAKTPNVDGLNEWRVVKSSFTPVLNSADEIYGILILLQDVTEQVEARQKIEDGSIRLAEAQKQLLKAVEVSKVGFFDWNIEQDIVTCSQQMLRDWGLIEKGNAALKLADIASRVHPDDHGHVTTEAKSAVATRSPLSAQYRVRRLDGQMIWIEAQGEITFDDRQQPVRFFGTSIDISERKRSEAQIVKAKDKAEAANSAKNFFLSNMSHEIRTPLGAILGYSELLKDPALNGAESASYIEIIMRNGAALTKIIDDILDLARAESGNLETRSVNFSIEELLSGVMDLYAQQARQKQLHLNLSMDPRVPVRISSDPARLRQVLVNLVGNAIKFTASGRIDVSLKAMDIDDQSLILAVDVQDTGIGMDERQRKSMFQPFVQGDSSNTRAFGGTGVGLALSQRLAKALGGEISIIESNPEKGSTFRFTFPAQLALAPDALPERPAPQPRPISANVAPLSDLNLLVVDDSADNLTLFENFLRKNGAKVETARDGKEAVDRAMLGHYDLVLMDIQMPKMDGYQASAALRARGYRVPIVALTAHAMPEDHEKSKLAGFAAHLTKPIQLGELIDTIVQISAKPRA